MRPSCANAVAADGSSERIAQWGPPSRYSGGPNGLFEFARILRVFVERRLSDDPITLEALADKYGVSHERVRQIEMRAFQKVQDAVKSRVAAAAVH